LNIWSLPSAQSLFPTHAGIIGYGVDLEARIIARRGCNGKVCTEAYPTVTVAGQAGIPVRSNRCPKTSPLAHSSTRSFSFRQARLSLPIRTVSENTDFTGAC
jgi:hypothetical protein